MVSLASNSTDGWSGKKLIVNISLKNALTIPGLVTAMKDQLDPSFLKVEQEVYVVRVRYGNTIFRITGTHAEWRAFFVFQKKYAVNKHQLGNGIQ
jgi:hypothetical protein